MTGMRKCFFFDRDGIINRPPGGGYVERWEEFKIIPEFLDILRIIISWGYAAVVVTNQRGVALGRLSRESLEDIHDRMRELLRRKGVDVLDVFYCPHDNDECDCRKPKPGMLVAAAAKHGMELEESWMVGDSERDIQAGLAAGCRTIRVAGEAVSTGADYRVAGMENLANLLRSLRAAGEL